MEARLQKLRTQPVSHQAEHAALRVLFYDTDRYVMDFSGLLQRGWQQYDTDQDAAYFGVWVNKETREVVTYAEGDWSLGTSPTDEEFTAQLASMAEYYGEAPPAFTVIDPEANTVTKVYSARPQ